MHAVATAAFTAAATIAVFWVVFISVKVLARVCARSAGKASTDDTASNGAEFDVSSPNPPWTRRRMDLGDDPLDPHGDGTIREGDPMFEAFRATMDGDADAIFATRNDDGTWDVEEVRNDE